MPTFWQTRACPEASVRRNKNLGCFLQNFYKKILVSLQWISFFWKFIISKLTCRVESLISYTCLFFSSGNIPFQEHLPNLSHSVFDSLRGDSGQRKTNLDWRLKLVQPKLPIWSDDTILPTPTMKYLGLLYGEQWLDQRMKPNGKR